MKCQIINHIDGQIFGGSLRERDEKEFLEHVSLNEDCLKRVYSRRTVRTELVYSEDTIIADIYVEGDSNE